MRIKLPAGVAGLIRRLHPQIKRKIRSALSVILKEPTSGKQLRGELAEYRSFRIGKIRIIYREKNSSSLLKFTARSIGQVQVYVHV